MLASYIFFLLLLQSVHSQLISQCSQPLQQPSIHFKTVKASRSLEFLPNPKFNLLYQMLNHPCMEVQYYSGNLGASNQYRIHGTCNFQQMFRFTARRTPYSCWHLTMDILDRSVPGAEIFEQRRLLKEFYEVKFTEARGIPVALERTANKTRRHVMFDFVDSGKHLEHILRRIFGSFEEDTIGAEIPECQCSNRSQIEVWAKLKGRPQFLRVHFIVQAAGAMVGLLGLGYGAYRFWFTRGDARDSVRLIGNISYIFKESGSPDRAYTYSSRSPNR